MVTVIGGDKPVIDGYLSQEAVDALLNGVTADQTPDEVAQAHEEIGREFGASPRPKIAHSLERLSHFNCGSCKGWWSIGDWVQPARTHLYCPWCGTLQAVAV